MIRPFRRRRRYSDAEVVAAVRHSLDRHSAQAPPGDYFTERVLAAVERAGQSEDEPTPVHAPRRRVLLPLVAAAAVVALLAGVVLAVTRIGGGEDKSSPVGSRTFTSQPAPTVATPTSPAPSAATKTATAQAGPSTLTGVKVIDLTFTSDTNGWALATADCLDGKGGACTALMHTTDGNTWISATNPGVNVDGVKQGCAFDVCATHIRFATPDIGYVYGPGVLYMTTDGGTHWQHQDGGALALESADGNVVRVTSLDPLTVQTAENGSSTWTTATLTGSFTAGAGAAAPSVELVRDGPSAYVLVQAPGTGNRIRDTALFRSSNDGKSWSGASDPCESNLGGDGGGSYYGEALAAGSGTISILCRHAQTPEAVLISSTDHGMSFPTHSAAPQRAGSLARSGDTVLLGLDDLTRSIDDGKTWQAVPGFSSGFTFVGFESDSTARVVSGSTIWTTHDAGRSWAPVRFQ